MTLRPRRRCNTLRGIFRRTDGTLCVIDEGSHRLRRISTTGTVSTIAGNGNGYKDGPVTEAQFQSPFGVGRDRAGNLYVSEQVGRIRKITPARVVSTLASNLSMTAGTDGGGGTAAGSGGAVGGPCQDGVACTASDVCGGDGKCAPGKSKACNDGDDCTTDACDTLTGGCLNTPVAGCF